MTLIEKLDARTIRRFHFVGIRDGQRDYLANTDEGIIYLNADEIVDGTPDQYAHVTTDRGENAQILLSRDILSREQADAHGVITETSAAELADTVNRDSGIGAAYDLAQEQARHEEAAAEARIDKAVALAHEAAARQAEIVEAAAVARAVAVAAVVEACGGNQSEAARRLGLDQSTVNKLVQKARMVQALDNAGRELDAAMSTSELTSRGIPAEQGNEALNQALQNLTDGTTPEA